MLLFGKQEDNDHNVTCHSLQGPKNCRLWRNFGRSQPNTFSIGQQRTKFTAMVKDKDIVIEYGLSNSIFVRKTWAYLPICVESSMNLWTCRSPTSSLDWRRSPPRALAGGKMTVVVKPQGTKGVEFVPHLYSKIHFTNLLLPAEERSSRFWRRILRRCLKSMIRTMLTICAK